MIKSARLSRRFGRLEAVKDLNLDLPRSSIFGFVGPNGAGKTTTLKMLATLLPPTQGEAWVNGYEVSRHPSQVRSSVGYMPDYSGTYDDLTVYEYLDFFAMVHRVPSRTRKKTVEDLLDLVDLAAKRNDYVEHLSRGMKQRLSLARCLVHDPEVLLLDEPASGLDPRARVEMRALLTELRNMGKTIVLSSHILPVLAEICSHIGIIDRGRLVASGPVEQIMALTQGKGTLQIRVLEDPERAMDIVKLHPEVGETWLEGGALLCEYSGPDESLPELLRSLLVGGVPVTSFTRAAERLEDVFMRITEGELNDSESRPH